MALRFCPSGVPIFMHKKGFPPRKLRKLELRGSWHGNIIIHAYAVMSERLLERKRPEEIPRPIQ